MTMKEADITKQIRDLLKALGIFHFKHWGGPMSVPGVSDILGCYRGRMMAIEVKCPGNKLTQLQKNFLDNVNEAGGIAFVAYCIEDVVEGLSLKNVKVEV